MRLKFWNTLGGWWYKISRSVERFISQRQHAAFRKERPS